MEQSCPTCTPVLWMLGESLACAISTPLPPIHPAASEKSHWESQTTSFPLVNQVAVGRKAKLQDSGGDWPTPVGNSVGSTIQGMELAHGHRAALDCLLAEAPQLIPHTRATRDSPTWRLFS